MLPLLYRCLLRLHPPAFRRRFGDEMLSIFEQAPGKLVALRLLADGFVSLTRQWLMRAEFWNEIPAPASKPALDGVPSFCSLDPFRPRAAAVLPGLVLSLAVFSLTGIAIKYSWIHVLHVRIPAVQFDAQFAPRFEEPQPIPPSLGPSEYRSRARVLSPTNPPSATPASATAPASRPVSNQPTPAASVSKTAGSRSSRPVERTDSKAQEIALTPAEAKQTATAVQSFANVPAVAVPDEPPLDAASRHRVIEGTIANLNKYYVDPKVAQRMSSALRAHETNGDDNAISSGAAFADQLTTQMRNAGHDQYVEMTYSTEETPLNPPAPSSEDIARYRKDMQRLDCTFEKVEILAHNIGYMKLNAFPDASICGPTAKSAMAKLNHADAIIFDLRDNPGGYSNMVELLATYLFDRRTHLNDFFDRGENSTEESWTLPPIPGNQLADKPAFVLTSHTTFSAAEGFSYDLKMLKRATLVGETTSGRGHMGAPHRIDDHFTIRIPGMRVTNPISGTNWEGTGVEPDVKVRAADALKTAIHLAQAKLQR